MTKRDILKAYERNRMHPQTVRDTHYGSIVAVDICG